MYCKQCGKEIADDSKYCQYCGCNQDGSQSLSMSEFISFWKKHKIIFSIWIAWTLLHFSLLLSGSSNGDGQLHFYPFYQPLSDALFGYYEGFDFFDSNTLYYYDYSEFFVYVVFLPFIIFFIWKLLSKAFSYRSSIKMSPSITNCIGFLFGGVVCLATIVTVVIMLYGLFNSEVRCFLNVEEMGNPSSGWYIRHPDTKLYAYHLMGCLPLYSFLFGIVIISFVVYYYTRIGRTNVCLTILDKIVIWCAKIGIASYIGNMVALLFAIPTSQVISSIYCAIALPIFLLGTTNDKINKILKFRK